MNSLGRGISDNRRVANPPVRIVDGYNPRNQTAVLNSFTTQPRGSQITNWSMNMYPGRMNDVDPFEDDRIRALGERVSQVAPHRMKNLSGRIIAHSMPNDRNAFTAH